MNPRCCGPAIWRSGPAITSRSPADALSLLATLARRQGRIVGREELYATVWGAPLREQDRSVDVYVHKLRCKLAGAIPGWRFIHTHFGFGYRFEPEHRASHPFHKGGQHHDEDGFR